jgi:hypothetical protein
VVWHTPCKIGGEHVEHPAPGQRRIEEKLWDMWAQVIQPFSMDYFWCAYCAAHTALAAGNATHIKTGTIVSVAVSVFSLGA